MKEKEPLTDELLKQIMDSSNPESFLDKSAFSDMSLSDYLNKLLEEKGLKRSKVIKDAHINETFGYQIFTGQRNASRNKVLAIALAMKLDVDETQHLLSVANVGCLYCKNRRDALILFCISHGYDLFKTDEELFHFGEETISPSGSASEEI